MADKPTKMTTATAKMADATTKAAKMAPTTMTTAASSTASECGGGHDRQNAGQNQTDR